MRTWHTLGALGDKVVELSFREWIGLLFGNEVATGSVVIAVGRSSLKSLGEAPSREQQLKTQ